MKKKETKGPSASDGTNVKYRPVEATEVLVQEPQEAGGAELGSPPGLVTDADMTVQSGPIQVDEQSSSSSSSSSKGSGDEDNDLMDDQCPKGW